MLETDRVQLEVENLSRNFQSRWAVRDIDFQIQGGETVALLGANGAGKSTLMRLLAGWLPVATGRIIVSGTRLRTSGKMQRRKMMLLGEPELYEGNVVDIITQAISDYEVDRPNIEHEVADWFQRLGLVGTYGKTSNALSKGQRFKVAMVCLFVVRPVIWLLDEPFSAGLDAIGLEILESEMKKQAMNGGIVLFSSQWPQHANRLADRAMVLHEGRLTCDLSAGESVQQELIEKADPALASVLSGLMSNVGKS